MSNNKEKFSSFKDQKSLTEGWRKYSGVQKAPLNEAAWKEVSEKHVEDLADCAWGSTCLVDYLDKPVDIEDLDAVFELVKGLRSKYVINKYQKDPKEGAIYVLERAYEDATGNSLEKDLTDPWVEHEGGMFDWVGAGDADKAKMIVQGIMDEIELQKESSTTGIAVEIDLLPFDNEGRVFFYDAEGNDITRDVLSNGHALENAQAFINRFKRDLLRDTYARHGVDFIRAFSIAGFSPEVEQYEVPRSRDPRDMIQKNRNWQNWWQGEKRSGIRESKLNENLFTKIRREPYFTVGAVTKRGAKAGRSGKEAAKADQKASKSKSRHGKQYHLDAYAAIAKMLRGRGYDIPTGEKARLEKINQMVDDAGLEAGIGGDFHDYEGMIRTLDKEYPTLNKGKEMQESLRKIIRNELKKLNSSDDSLDESAIAKSVIENLMEYEYFKDLALQTKKKDVE